MTAQPAALWALGSEARHFTARGCHLHTPGVWHSRTLCGGFQKAPPENYPVRGWMGPPGQGLCRQAWGHCTPQLGIFGAGSTPPLNKARGPRFPLNSPMHEVHWRGETRQAEAKPININLRQRLRRKLASGSYPTLKHCRQCGFTVDESQARPRWTN